MLRYRENFPLDNISPGIVSVYLYIGSKAAEYFQMKIVKVPVNEKKRTVNIKAMRKAITRNTVMVMAIVSLYPCLSQRMRGLQLSLAAILSKKLKLKLCIKLKKNGCKHK